MELSTVETGETRQPIALVTVLPVVYHNVVIGAQGLILPRLAVCVRGGGGGVSLIVDKSDAISLFQFIVVPSANEDCIQGRSNNYNCP